MLMLVSVQFEVVEVEICADTSAFPSFAATSNPQKDLW